MYLKVILPLIVTAGALVANDTAFDDQALPSTREVETHPALGFGAPDTGHIIDYGTFVMSYDGRLRSARWVAEKVTKDSLKKHVDRKNQFRPDRRIPSEYRSELSDYKGSGLDRGHLTPSGNHLFSRPINSATFFLSNMSPQVGNGFNRSYWRRLEEAIRKHALDDAVKAVYVFTGPVFMPDQAPRQGRRSGTFDSGTEGDADEDEGDLSVTYKLIGGNHVPVPTHYFKALLVVPTDPARSVKLYTFVLPNSVIDKETSLETFARSVDYLEHWAGFDLWSNLKDDVEDFKEGTAWRPWEALGN